MWRTLDTCKICNKLLTSTDTSVLTEKGVLGILKVANERGDETDICAGQKIHTLVESCTQIQNGEKGLFKKMTTNAPHDHAELRSIFIR